MNSVVISGRICKELEIRKTEAGVHVLNFQVAVKKSFKMNGEYGTDFIYCVAWRQQAEFLHRFFQKGDMVNLIGQLSTRSYEKDGQTHYVTEVYVDRVEFGESRKSSEAREDRVVNEAVKGAGKEFATPDDDFQLPFDM